jgi:copper chaperone CopZ
VRVAIRKLPGVESVDVSLERATADIRLRAGNAITLAQLRQIIKNNGFASKEAIVTVIGNLIERGENCNRRDRNEDCHADRARSETT